MAKKSSTPEVSVRIIGLGGGVSADTVIEEGKVVPGSMIDSVTFMAYCKQFLDDGWQLASAVSQGVEGTGTNTRVMISLTFVRNAASPLTPHQAVAVVGDFQMSSRGHVEHQESRLARLLDQGFVYVEAWPLGFDMNGSTLFHLLIQPTQSA